MKREAKLPFLKKMFESKKFKCSYFENMLSRKNIKNFHTAEACEINSMMFSNEKYRILVETARCGDWPNKVDYNFNCYLCPDEAFDRWANSKHIKFSVYGCRLSKKEFDKAEFKKWFDLMFTKVTWLADTIPIDYFNCGINIEL